MSAPSLPSVHPRRRAASPNVDPAALAESLAGMSLKKGTTFHTPNVCQSDLFNPLEQVDKPCSMPPRSTTCPKDLEDLLILAGERRAAEVIAKVEEAIENKQALAKVLCEPETLPSQTTPDAEDEAIPVREHRPQTGKDQEQEQEQEHEAYDSGLGSSIASSEAGSPSIKLEHEEKTRRLRSSSAINRSAGSVVDPSADHLSEFAVEQIHKFIIKPILREPALSDFHQLIQSVPRRIGEREIRSLRDLEKTLIFLAPDYSPSPRAYLKFCETSIHCLYATVDGVHESDQRLPTDRPYTNHYFSDLVAQIRRYAQILAATRERHAKGEVPDEMDATTYVKNTLGMVGDQYPRADDACSDERIELRGGVAETGRPAELVRRNTKSGKTISLADGRPLSPSTDVTASAKRPMDADADADDDGVLRSMARRKKGELPKTYTCSEPECDKQFKRPCDLTKHLKTHERPYKCPEPDCDFHQKGFPTEKECDRHWGDRHDPNPTMYKCWYSPCDYSSKREHNLKSHMEKAHQFDYVRSKGVKTVKPSAAARAKVMKPPVGRPIRSAVGPRESTSTSASTPSVLGTPYTASEPSPFSAATLSSDSTSPIFAGAQQSANASPFDTSSLGVDMDMDMDFNMTSGLNPDFAGHFNTHLDFANMDFAFGQAGQALDPASTYPYTPSLQDDRRSSHVSSMTTPASGAFIQDHSFEDAMTTNPPTPADLLPTPEGLFLPNSVFWNPKEAGPSNMDYNNYMGAGNYTFGTQEAFAHNVNTGMRNDVTLTSTQEAFGLPADEGFSGEGAQDFSLGDYLQPSGSNEPLFSDNTGPGSQFADQAEENPYAKFFPELDMVD